MKKIFHLVLCLAVVLGALLYFGLQKVPVAEEKNEDFSLPSAQTFQRGEVTVEVFPVEVGVGSPEWKFNIIMNTHSVELDHNLSEIIELSDGKGKVYKPIAWQGSDKGGHHRDNVLIFNPLVPRPQEIEIRVRDIGDAGVITFRWTLDS